MNVKPLAIAKSPYQFSFAINTPNLLTGIKPSGGYEVYCVHPQYGSCFFVVEQNENCRWVAEIKPPYVRNALVRFIGQLIEEPER